ncbi:MAG TPA: DUF1330 domain-containing protein [Terriglobales bacterium]|nr:DUF1330 domain-containing protein [Terriglobales bacterium]
MKSNRKLALALLTGIAIGIAGALSIHAQQVKPAPGYIIGEVELKPGADTEALKQYGEKVPETLAPFNHQYLIRRGKTVSLEGEPPKTIIVIAFDSVEQAQAWYNSPAYNAIKPLRQNSTNSRLFIAEGMTPK